MAIQLATTRGATTGRNQARTRPMRNTRLVSLRSSLPTGLVTLRHDVPEYLTHELEQDSTPKVEKKGQAAVRVQVQIETPARKGS
jgi:hypothetical protein